MRIATWNINGLRARKEFVEMWLEERQPDLVGFQELKMQDVDFPYESFEDLGYEVFVHGQKSWNGVAILSKAGGKLVQKGLKGQEDFGARFITVEVNDLEFTTCYCPNGKDIDHPDYIRKLSWYDSLISESKKTYGEADHPDVDELYKRVSNIDPKISIATVYRTVKLFEESGILMKHDFKDGKARYELNDDHNHLIDIKSGNIIEFTDEEIEKIQKRIAEKHGYKLVDSKLELYCVKK